MSNGFESEQRRDAFISAVFTKGEEPDVVGISDTPDKGMMVAKKDGTVIRLTRRDVELLDKSFPNIRLLAFQRVEAVAGMKTIRRRAVILRAEPRPPSVDGIMRFADFWGLDLRKRIKRMATDFDAEIRELHQAGRYKTARWNKALAWGYAFWYIGRGPIDWARDYVIKGFTAR